VVAVSDDIAQVPFIQAKVGRPIFAHLCDTISVSPAIAVLWFQIRYAKEQKLAKTILDAMWEAE
jgi:hypothetical protein